jgi:Flp pilus assembly protein TadB
MFVALSLLAPAAIADEVKSTYTHESEGAVAQQLAAKQIQSAIVDVRARSVRLTLTDGRHVRARYPKHQAPATAAKLRAHGVQVTVLSATHHHKIRYIVGAVVIVVIVLVGAVLLVRRRRQRD